MKKKVGIITHYYKNDNYGGLLQAYALCQVLNSMGVEATQICYQMTGGKRKFIKKVLSRAKSLLCQIKSFIFYKQINRGIIERKQLLELFRNNIPHTDKVYNINNIASCDNFDVYITGSDQVWNPEWIDSAYLLEFVKNNKVKISYAASIGKDELTDEQKAMFKLALEDYRAISVREKSAKSLLQPFVSQNIQCVLDPTLLLNAEEWDNKNFILPYKYVFCYFLCGDKKHRELAQSFAVKNGLKLVTIPYLNGRYRKVDAQFKSEKLNDVSPENFLSLINNAEFIFTDSFHATVFSSIFKKEFVVFANVDKKMNNRIYTLTEIFGTTERFCDTTEKMSMEYILNLQTIEYNKDFSKFDELKRISIDFLKKNIGI